VRGARQIAGRLVAVLLMAAPAAAAAQPEWLPPEVRPARPPSPFGGPPAAEPDDPCRDPLLAPIAPPVRDTGFDRAIDACPAARLALSARGAELDEAGVELREASLFVEVSHLLLRDVEIAAGGRALDTRFAEGAGVDDDDLEAGPVYLAARARFAARHLGGRPLRLAWGLRLDLPWTDTRVGTDAAVVAAAPQLAASLGLAPRVALHARLAALLGLTRIPGDIETRRAVVGSSDLAWAPIGVLALAAGIEAQAGWFESGLDHLLVRGGLRVPFGCRARLHLGAAAPVAGDEPTDLVGELAFALDW
jgi:hypothetical protein